MKIIEFINYDYYQSSSSSGDQVIPVDSTISLEIFHVITEKISAYSYK
jgi:hypothetical protein